MEGEAGEGDRVEGKGVEGVGGEGLTMLAIRMHGPIRLLK
jgi:hypothetical protein